MKVPETILLPELATYTMNNADEWPYNVNSSYSPFSSAFLTKSRICPLLIPKAMTLASPLISPATVPACSNFSSGIFFYKSHSIAF